MSFRTAKSDVRVQKFGPCRQNTQLLFCKDLKDDTFLWAWRERNEIRISIEGDAGKAE